MQLFIIAILVIVVLCLVVRIFVLRRKQMPQSASHSAVYCPGTEGAKETLTPADEEKTAVADEVKAALDVPNAGKTTTQDETESKTDDDDDKGVTQNVELIAGLHRVFEEEKVFLRPDIHIEDVAKMLLTNRTYVTRLMRQEYGLSFIEYVNIARIQHSQSLLYTTNMTLDEVAERSGFQSTSNYCRAFKRYIGTTPLAWKNSLPEVKK